jgi:sugar phosphate isomerase/epimerase
MDYSRREFGKMALAAAPAVALFETGLGGAALWQAKPNSKFNGVQIGAITYSYRSMPDQSAEATLKYIVDSGISAVELMGGPITAYAQARTGFTPSGGGARGGGRAGGRGAVPGAGAAGGAAAGAAVPSAPPAPVDMTKSWKGQPCPAGRGGGGGGAARGAAPGAGAAAGAAAGAPAAAPPAEGGRGGRGAQTPEQIAAQAETRKWRNGLSMDIFKDLRKMYNDAGVSIYAVKDVQQATDEDLEYTFAVASALGANHVTLELPSGPNASATLKRLGDWAAKSKMYAAYHTHTQGSMTAFDEAFALSKGNMANVDLGHFVAGGNQGGTPLDFLNKFHDRIASFHLKDRTLPEHCALNLPWGTGETPIKEILRLVRDKKWNIPASIELEYEIPPGSDAVKEVAKCVAYCKAALA